MVTNHVTACLIQCGFNSPYKDNWFVDWLKKNTSLKKKKKKNLRIETTKKAQSTTRYPPPGKANGIRASTGYRSWGQQWSAERDGRYTARYLHLNMTGPSHPRNPCLCHSYCLVWCSFWCGGPFTYIKLTKRRTRLYPHSTQESSLCVIKSAADGLQWDECVQNRRHLKWGQRHILKAYQTLYPMYVLPPRKNRENN